MGFSQSGTSSFWEAGGTFSVECSAKDGGFSGAGAGAGCAISAPSCGAIDFNQSGRLSFSEAAGGFTGTGWVSLTIASGVAWGASESSGSDAAPFSARFAGFSGAGSDTTRPGS